MSNEVKTSSSMPVDPQTPGSSGKALALPISYDPAFYASKADENIIRLSKLIKTTAGLGSLLSITSYSLYIAGYLHAKSPARAEIIAKISQLLGRPSKLSTGASKPAGVAAISPLAPYIGLINDTRFSIRLTGLIPFYVLLRTLVKTTNPKDAILHRLALVQAVCYIIFTTLENLWLLSSKSLINPARFQKFGGPLGLMKWSCRAWIIALSCEFGRLAREAAIAKESGAEKTMSEDEKKKVEQKWWTEFFTASAYFPMAVHYSVDGGIGMNQALIGLSGVFGGLAGFKRAWAATKD